MRFSERIERPAESRAGRQSKSRTRALHQKPNGAHPSEVRPQERAGKTRHNPEGSLQYATELLEAREAIARLVLALPKACREQILGEDVEGPRTGRRWPLEQLEACFSRVTSYAASHDEPEVRRIVEEMHAHKKCLDQARDALIVTNLRYVPHVVKKFGHYGIPYMDLVQEGNIGLMKAVDRFDPRRGYKFSTYAFWWIRQAISNAFVSASRLIRLPANVSEDLRHINRANREFEEEFGRRPAPEELSERMNMSLRKVKRLLDVGTEPFPLEDFGGEEEGQGAEMLRYLPDSGIETPLESTLKREMHQQIAAAFTLLTAREESIVRLRFGIDDCRRRTLTEIGKMLNLSRERVRQIELTALRKIQAQGTELLADYASA